ncbi:MAG: PEP-CTERM sorting domain-containing protein, partial [Planctomycetota bacterium]|nr:PEP-CTERM sorting domain-containing protein [Planctomycetota bacterium]
EGTAGSLAYDINNVGQIVGYYEDLQTIMRPCLWDVDGTFHDLTALVQSGPTERFERAVLINEAGQIAVAGSWDVGYLLAPIPEPATLSLLALGGLAALRRRRK